MAGRNARSSGWGVDDGFQYARRWSALLLLFSALSSLPAQAKVSDLPESSEDSKRLFGGKPVALTISGGISLGSYEAGVNWALMRILKETGANLSVVTGASAGNINTLLSSYTWCGLDAEAKTPEKSLFWKTWVPVDLRGLLPVQFETGYDKGEGLFTRAPFKDIVKTLGQLAAAPQPQACDRLHLGITLSKRTPGHVDVGEPPNALRVGAMRYIVPFNVSREAGQPLLFKSPPQSELTGIDSLGLHQLASNVDQPIPFEQMSAYVQAASSFPYAFGAMTLKGWTRLPHEQAYTEKEGVFLDGGVFDNVPFGLSLELLKKSSQFNMRHAEGADAAAYVLYVDPDQRRNGSVSGGEKDTVPLGGVDSVLTFLDGAVNSARKYELQTVARYDLPQMKDTRLRLTKRAVNVFGEYYGAFAAFTDQKFREMDFYSGVYDALESTAVWVCEGLEPAVEAHDNCVMGTIVRLGETISLPAASPRANYVVRSYLRSVHPRTDAFLEPPELPGENGNDLLSAEELREMVKVLTARDYDKLDDLLDALVLESKSEEAKKAGFAWTSPVIVDREAYFTDMAGRLLLRGLKIERDNKNGNMVRALAGVNLVARSMMRQQTFDADPSTIPSLTREGFAGWGAVAATFLLPYYLGLEFPMELGTVGFRVEKRASVVVGSHFRLIVPGTFAWLGPRNGWQVSGGLGGKVLLYTKLGLALDFSASWAHWGKAIPDLREPMLPGLRQEDLSLQLGVSVFEVLRLGGTYSPWHNVWTVSAGVIDFDGIAYWMMRMAFGL